MVRQVTQREKMSRERQKKEGEKRGFLFPFSGGKPFSCPKTQIIGVACCDTSFGVAGQEKEIGLAYSVKLHSFRMWEIMRWVLLSF